MKESKSYENVGTCWNFLRLKGKSQFLYSLLFFNRWGIYYVGIRVFHESVTTVSIYVVYHS